LEDHQKTTPSVSEGDSEEVLTQPAAVEKSPQKPVEVGGQKGPEPTRYGDWEKAGRCTDF
jgi:hypothetical protein